MFNSVIPNAMTLSAFLMCIFAALVLGVLTALVFSFRNKHSGSLILALAVLPPIVTLVIMMVNGNIGAGLAVAGTFSLVRFRSAPGTAREICGLFMSTAIGITCGMGFIGIAAVFFLVMAVFLVLLSLFRFGETAASSRQLKITIPENLDYDGLFDDIFEKYTSRHELVRVKTTNMGTLYELTYTINLKTPEVSKQFIDDIRCRNGNLNIICGRASDKDAI
ncbi:MAG: DUF4956 domain-containing protein [Candidatus Limivicinus sp.]|nr:DUF4956 domain-containing protein [Candidatus Limivicinus sp.]